MMIDYKLAKQLKDIGFPQKHTRKEIKGVMNPLCNCGAFLEDELHIPTLSELIDACGEEKELGNKDSIWEFRLGHWGNKWIAGYIQPPEWYMKTLGNTKEEAVAKLYIALNKK